MNRLTKLAYRLMLVAAAILVLTGVPSTANISNYETSSPHLLGVVEINDLVDIATGVSDGGHTQIAIVPLIMLIAAIVAIVVALVELVKWIWKQFQTCKKRSEWEEFKRQVINNKNACATVNGSYKSDHPPLWTCEAQDGSVILSGDYSTIFSGTPWDGDPLRYETQPNGEQITNGTKQ